jgi:minor extracellular serine protease Vpr
VTRIRSVLALSLAGSMVVVLALVGSAGARVSDGGADRFQQVSDGAVESTQMTPLRLDQTPATFVVQLEGNSVAEVQAERGRRLSQAEKEQIKADLRGRQEAVKGQIQAAGAEVLITYQSAINGIKVRAGHDKVAALAAIPGVVAVRPVLAATRPDNTNGVPMVGAPGVWAGTPGFRGEGMKIAVIDTGVDYTHANFGGPGTVAAYNAANATDTAPANPAHFGPAAPKVKGGIDLVGDAYNADGTAAQQVPHPDPNPLDCNGHGSHVAGTAAGFGVLGTGATYAGPYNASTVAGNTWNVGPGVAPKADVYAVRVFGCLGSTNVTVDAIEWSVDNDMDVINMSLGSPFGSAGDASAVASTNAAKSGVIVVTSAGNNGPSQYITGAPGAGTGAIATAAIDPVQTNPGANITTPAGPVTAINANGEPFTTQTLTVKKLADVTGTPENESLGCSVAAFGGPLAAGTLAVVQRGVCARVAKAIFGQQAGATMVLMVNNAPMLPPFEGKITSNPDDGTPFTVTIPFLGVSSADNAKFVTGQSVTVSPTSIANTGFKGFASFTSGGPRTGDSWLKPDITGPGVSIMSTDSGSGNAGTIISGTSMASPHVAGIAALVKQAHPSWRNPEDYKAAIVNTGRPGEVTNYRTSRGGTGLADAGAATTTQAVAIGDRLTGALNFGFEELAGDYSKTKRILIRNHGSSAITFGVAQANAAGSSHSVSFSAGSVSVPGGGQAAVEVTLNVPVGTAGNTDAFREVAGLVTLTPGSGENAGVMLRVPYYLVPRALSNVNTRMNTHSVRASSPTANVRVTNSGPIAGDADFYAWGLEDPKDSARVSNDLYGVGLQSFPFPSATDATRRLLVFGVSTFGRWSNAATNEFDIGVDVDNDGRVDYVVVGADVGAITTDVFDGVMGSFVFSTRSPGASRMFNAAAPHDGTTLLLPFLTSQMCRSGEPCLSQATNPRITYDAISFDLVNGGVDPIEGIAKFNVWNPSISQGMFVSNLAPGAGADVPVTINPTEWAQTPAKGVMVITHDDRAGREEADLQELTLR